MTCLNNFAPQDFLDKHWQQQALFSPNAVDVSSLLLDPNELSGLALEDFVESRLITQVKTNQFQLECGPFDEDRFARLGTNNWTLLIQAIDHYLEDYQALKQLFRFLPSWRLDDIMISISPEGGTVGPHFDQYDVFLIQASGTREWQLGQTCDQNSELEENNSLSILKNFEQKQSYQCQAGDMLYIPPGLAHWGTATSDNCITISIGFRAPSYGEIIHEISNEAISQLSEDHRYTDTALATTDSRGELASTLEVSKATIQHIKARLEAYLLDEDFLQSRFAYLMSEPKYPEHFDFISQDEAEESLKLAQESGLKLCLRSDSRLMYSHNQQNPKILNLAVNGETCTVDKSLQSLLEQLSQAAVIDYSQALSEPMRALSLFLISVDALTEAQ